MKTVSTVGEAIQTLVEMVNDPLNELTMESPIRGAMYPEDGYESALTLAHNPRLVEVEPDEEDAEGEEDSEAVVATFAAGIAVTFE